MPEQPDIVVALTAIEGRLDRAEMSPEADARIRGRVLGDSREKQWPWRLNAAVAMASFVAGALFLWSVQPPGSVASGPSHAGSDLIVEAGFVAHGQACSSQDAEGKLLLTGECVVSLAQPQATISTRGATHLRREEGGIRFFEGMATFDVAPIRSPGTPLHISVSAGAIEVVGTRFTVVQTADGSGYVDLFAGSVRFVRNHGEAAVVQIGARYSWEAPARDAGDIQAAPQAQSSELQPSLSRTHQERQRSAPPNEPLETPSAGDAAVDNSKVAEVVARVYQLRARRQYVEASQVLTVTLSEGTLPETAAEVLSFELGTLLTHFIADQPAACAHWFEHRKRFAVGRLGPEVQQVIAELGCP